MPNILFVYIAVVKTSCYLFVLHRWMSACKCIDLEEESPGQGESKSGGFPQSHDPIAIGYI